LVCSFEVTLEGKPYTQMALEQVVTRVGADPRCEFALPKSSGVTPWHLTLVHAGSAVLCYRAHKDATFTMNQLDVDKALLKNGDLIDLGRVRLRVRLK
jgi:hypothetical protein